MLVGLQERIAEQGHKLGGTEALRLEIEADAPKAPAKVYTQTMRDPLALQELVPDLRASQETNPLYKQASDGAYKHVPERDDAWHEQFHTGDT